MNIFKLFKKKKEAVIEPINFSINFTESTEPDEPTDTMDFEKANPYNKYGRHRLTELIDTLNFGQPIITAYKTIHLGQMKLFKIKDYSHHDTKYELYFRDVKLFTGRCEINEEDQLYFGEWHHEGKWQDDILDEIKKYLENYENIRHDSEIRKKKEVELKLSEYK